MTRPLGRTHARFAEALLGLVAVITACSAPVASGPSGEPATAPSSEPSSVGASPTISAEAVDRMAPVAAARAFLKLTAARFDMAVDRLKPGQPMERQWEASGVVDPATDRGSMDWRLFYPPLGPLASLETPQPPSDIDIIWNATDYWTSGSATREQEREWTHATRERAREAAIIGRLQEEPIGLVRLVVEADPGTVASMAPGSLDGASAVRWSIAVPLGRVKAAFIPPDTYLSLSEIFDIDSFPLEVWTVDDRIRRVGYVLEREKAPYGGPDRFETYYDWSGFDDPIDLQIPPPGLIVELSR